MLVAARISDCDPGLSLFAVPNDTAGLTVHGYATVDGRNAADLVFEGVRTNAQARSATKERGSLR